MTTNEEMERIVRSWLEPGLTTLTDDVLDPVLDQLPGTPQRRPLWSLRRVRPVSSFAKFSLAAAAVVVVALVGFSLASRPGLPVVGVTPSPSPSDAPSQPDGCNELDGTYTADIGNIGVSATVPDGWFGVGDEGFYLQNKPCGMAGTAIVEVSIVDGVYADACTQDAVVETRTPAEVSAALAAQQGRQSVEPRATTVGGYAASQFDFAADTKNAGACRVGNLALWQGPEGAGIPALDPDHIVDVYVVDFDGTPVGVAATRCCTAEAPNLAATLGAIVESLRFEPGEATAVSPSPGQRSPLQSPSLPALSLPGAFASPAGEYGFDSGLRPSAGMHKFTGDGSREVADLTFSVLCDAKEWDEPTQHVNVAGFDAVYAEPYEPPVTFTGPEGDETTRAYALAVGDRTLCAFLTWHETTTDEERDALLQIVETIRAEHIKNGRRDFVRAIFTLDEGWDVG